MQGFEGEQNHQNFPHLWIFNLLGKLPSGDKVAWLVLECEDLKEKDPIYPYSSMFGLYLVDCFGRN